MQHSTFKQGFARTVILVVLLGTAAVSNALAGLDSYRIYLNDKLILEQYVNQPLDLRKLPLENAKAGDQLVIYYKHCTVKGPGTERSITLRDGKGRTLKKWEFENSARADASMVIPVRELLQLEKSNAGGDLSLYYAARELQKGEMLALLQLKES